MKDIYPQYADNVDLFAIGVHPGIVEDINTLETYRSERDHPWPVATAPSQVMAELGVTIQSTKIAFDSQGTIVYREGMGLGSDEEWHRVFTELSQSQ
ncbi:hypothetical protein GBAR_LOCUS17534 [Geodia barretti]|uniref:Uncharacterized protein n=1 Tax=Geodia barretti TaxID=519541 RepID=A0AA35SJX3_GEOBA|nr:hypothetical protein GBAR_LOCUS17534 [Geodia barretti]